MITLPAVRKVFTADDVWKGGYYELLVKPLVGSSEALHALRAALWSFPSVDGCYLFREKEPFEQARIKSCETGDATRLYGLATLPNGVTVPCGSLQLDYLDEEGMPLACWVSFYLPMGSLSLAYPVGAYPFGPMDKVSEWMEPVDSFLVKLARWTFEKEPFELALIGFELNTFRAQAAAIRASGVPDKRENGILWNENGELKWYPAT